MEDQKTRDQLNKLFKTYPQIIAVYFYGSQVGGYASKKSDLDLAVLVSSIQGLDYGGLYFKVSQIIKSVEIDLRIITRQTAPTFLFQVIKTGKCIYQRSNYETVQFEAKVLDEYYDGEHLRGIYDKYLKAYFKGS